MNSGISESDFNLRNGHTVHLRAADKSDEAALLRAFDRVSPESRYMRFMHVVGDLDIERLRKLLASFPESGQGIVATASVAGESEVVGSAMFLIGKDPTSCEFSTTVTDNYGGLGLGSALMTALISAAKQRGLQVMEGFVLAKNRPMLKLATRLGFSISPDPEDATVRICCLRLADCPQATTSARDPGCNPVG